MVTESPLRTEDELDELIAAFLDQVEAGRTPDPNDWLIRHPQFKTELARFFADRRQLEALAAPLRAVTHPLASVDSPGRLGDFQIVRELGRGGMGVVYEAEQLSLGRRVALKVLPFAAMLDKQQLARFKNEARAAATLDHSNIVAVYSVGVERGVHYYSMQLIEGESLAQVIERLRRDRGMQLGQRGKHPEDVALTIAQPAPSIEHPASTADTAPVAALSTIPEHDTREYFRTVARLGVQAAEALDHANGILHRDVKPANLLVDNDGKLWVTDFGLARMETDAGMTMTGDLIGTLRYMSPEQALANRVVVDHRTDIYSLGVTLYELLTLEPAYLGKDRHELLKSIAFDEPRRPRQANGHIPLDLETIVLKAIEKNPAQRYATTHELANDLRSFLDSEPIKAKPPTTRDRLIKWSRRHPAGVRATSLALLASAAVLAASVGWALRDRAARQALLEEQIALAIDEASTWYGAGKLTEAMSAIKRADGLLASGQDSDEIKRTVAQWRTDLGSAARLEEIRLDRGAQPSGSSDTTFVDRAYLKVFRQQGIDLPSLTVEESARRIGQSRIRDELVVALHDWRQTGSDDEQGENASKDMLSKSHLLQIARVADPDPWRNRLRDAVEQSDEAALLKLSSEEEVLAQPSATIILLTQSLTARKKHLPVAIDLLKQVQSQRPNDFWINIALANCLRTIHPQRTEEAIAFRTAAVALRPDSAYAYTHLGVALDSNGQYAEALAAFQRAIRLNPKDMITRGNLVGMYVQRGKQADAEALLREMLRLKPGDSREYEALARALAAVGKTAEAETAIREAIRREPNYFQAHRFLSGLLEGQGKLADAEAAAREAVRIRPDVLMSRCVLIMLLESQGKRDEAEIELAETVRMEPSGHAEYYAFAVVLARLDKFDEAERALREAIRQAPDFVAGHQELSVVLIRQKKYAESVVAQRDALRLAPGNVEILNTLAWLLATAPDDDVRNGKESMELATRACELTAYNVAGVIDTLAAAHAETGDFEVAVEWAEKALELADSNALRADLTDHLESFKARNPWREE